MSSRSKGKGGKEDHRLKGGGEEAEGTGIKILKIMSFS